MFSAVLYQFATKIEWFCICWCSPPRYILLQPRFRLNVLRCDCRFLCPAHRCFSVWSASSLLLWDIRTVWASWPCGFLKKSYSLELQCFCSISSIFQHWSHRAALLVCGLRDVFFLLCPDWPELVWGKWSTCSCYSCVWVCESTCRHFFTIDCYKSLNKIMMCRVHKNT